MQSKKKKGERVPEECAGLRRGARGVHFRAERRSAAPCRHDAGPLFFRIIIVKLFFGSL